MCNPVPRAHVSFGQRQDMELLNKQFLQDSKILGVPVSRRMRTLAYNMASRDKVEVDA